MQEAAAFLRGERPEILHELEEAMNREAQAQRFEKAAALRDTLRRLRRAIHERALAPRPLAQKIEDTHAGLDLLATALNLPGPPRRIEAYDVSNIGGTLAVGSMVCAVDGLPRRGDYRLFRIRTTTRADDTAMMAEMIRRRFARLQRDGGERPDLVLVDGGAGQLAASRAELDRLGLTDLPAAGLAKRFEELHLPGRSANDPLKFPADSPALHILQRLRDEAHRFALSYHRRLRLKRIRESVLDDIPGIGEKRKSALIAHFGSLARLRRANAEAIAAVPGFDLALAQQIVAALGAASRTAGRRTW